MSGASDPLAASPAFAAAGARAARAVADGHGCVVIMGQPAETGPLLVHAAAALAAEKAVLHAVPPERFTPTDLVQAGDAGVLVIADAERLGIDALRALEAHLRREPRAAPRARLLLTATDRLRETTAFPDLATLHRTALLVASPRLPAAEQAALLGTLAPRLSTGSRRAIARQAAGYPALLLPLAGRGGAGRVVLRLASRPLLTRILGQSVPLAALACALLAGVVLIHAPSRPPRPAPPESQGFLLPAAPHDQADAGVETEATDPPATGAAPAPDDGVTVDRENPDQAAAEAASHTARLVAARSGETLAAMYRRVYQGVRMPPSFDTVEAVNPVAPAPGLRLVFPAPREGWPR